MDPRPLAVLILFAAMAALFVVLSTQVARTQKADLADLAARYQDQENGWVAAVTSPAERPPSTDRADPL